MSTPDRMLEEVGSLRALRVREAVFMPTGTLANHRDPRARTRSPRVVVQETPHLQRHRRCSRSEGLTLMTLAPTRRVHLGAVEQRSRGRPPYAYRSGRANPVSPRYGSSVVFDRAEIDARSAGARRLGSACPRAARLSSRPPTGITPRGLCGPLSLRSMCRCGNTSTR